MITIFQPGIRNISHTQSTPATEWIISHDFRNTPALSVDAMIEVDGQLQTAIPKDVEYPDAFTIIIKWNQPHSGTARLG